MSRVTLHRIEKGEPAVTMGAYLNAIAALGLRMGLLGLPDSNEATSPTPEQDWIPARVRLDDYPQLRQLAWHVQGTDAVSPLQAWQIYERNWRHLDEQAIAPAEQRLIDALRVAMAGAASTDDV